MKVLDLFSGIGGFSLGLERAGMETIAFCEIDPFCQRVLRKHWPDVPIYKDVTKLKGEDVGPVDVICGGFPCQPFSYAGDREGAEDDRHLWPQFNRLVAESRPSWIIGENVPGIINLGLDDVLSDLEDQGYTARTFDIPACAVNAPHRRHRVWIVANSEHMRCDKGNARDQRSEKSSRCKHWDQFDRHHWETAFAGIRGVANGIPQRMDRLRAIGNSVVPQIPEFIGKAIMEAEYLN